MTMVNSTNYEHFFELAKEERTLEIIQYLRERADMVEAIDGMYGVVNAANQLRHEAQSIESRYNVRSKSAA